MIRSRAQWQRVRTERAAALHGRQGRRVLLLLCLVATVLVGCRQDMHNQPKVQPLEESDFFADGQASRLPIEGTVARGQLREDTVFYAGLTEDGELVEALPIELDAATLARGQDLFNAFCSPCHDRMGTGNGMIVQRGFKRPESFHSPRLRRSPPGYFFQVMTNGFAEMSSYAGQIETGERWAIAGYIRALQLSHAVPVEQLEESERGLLDSSQPTAEATAETDHGEDEH